MVENDPEGLTRYSPYSDKALDAVRQITEMNEACRSSSVLFEQFEKDGLGMIVPGDMRTMEALKETELPVMCSGGTRQDTDLFYVFTKHDQAVRALLQCSKTHRQEEEDAKADTISIKVVERMMKKMAVIAQASVERQNG